MSPDDYQKEIQRMRDAVQVFVEEQARSGAQTWPLAAALAEKAIEVLMVHHGKGEAERLLAGLGDALRLHES